MIVACTLPNASESISGVPFSLREADGAMVTGDVGEDVCAVFEGIPGYTVEGRTDPAAEAKAAAAAARAAIMAEAEAAGITLDGRLNNDKLRAALDAAKAAKAASEKEAADKAVAEKAAAEKAAADAAAKAAADEAAKGQSGQA